MRTRLRQAIEERAKKEGAASIWAARRRELERLQVSTIHSLCARILRENAISAGIDPGFEAIEEAEMQVLQEEAVRQAFNELVDEDSPGLELLAGLNIKEVREELARLIGRRGTVERLFDALEDQDARRQLAPRRARHCVPSIRRRQPPRLFIRLAPRSGPRDRSSSFRKQRRARRCRKPARFQELCWGAGRWR